MANPAPTINQINAFNATQGTTIDFNIIGGTELVRSNRIYIYDLSDNSLICTHLYVSTESIHELPSNTDGSIVYEDGKSSADFVNGAQYYAQIQTFTDIAGTEGGSGLSVAKMFWCLVDPTLTITTIPSTISTTSYNVSATYNANTSVVSNIIQQYQFNLYSAVGSLLQSSGVVVGSGEQQGTSTAYDISYNFTGLSVGSSYYVVVDVTTTQGMSVSAQSGTFTVSIDTPTLGEATVVNNACDGYISVTSNLSGEYGGSGSGETVSFETDSENVFTKLQVDLEPVQDLHGYDAPWVGGAGKNKLPLTLQNLKSQNDGGVWNENIYTFRGVSFTVNQDNSGNVISITANGTATGNATCVLTSNGTHDDLLGMILNGCPSGGGGSSFLITGYNLTDGTSIGVSDIGSGATIPSSLSGKSYRLYISVFTGYQANNIVFKPMVRSSTDSSTFAPYENICPISGHDEVGVSVVGKNLLDPTYRTDSVVGTNSNIRFYCNPSTIEQKLLLKSGVTYTLSYSGTNASGIYIKKTASTNAFIKYNSNYITFTPTEDFYGGIDIYWASAQDTTAINPILSIGTTATDYEPYNGQTYTQDIEATYTPTVQENEPYQFKRTGDVGGDRETIELVGGTVAWNQLYNPSATQGVNDCGLTLTKDTANATWTLNGTTTGNGNKFGLGVVNKQNHVYYLTDNTNQPSVNIHLSSQSFGQDRGSGAIIKNTSANKTWYYVFNVQVDVGTEISNLVLRPMVIDLTQMFGSTIADYIYSLEQAHAGAGVAFFRNLFPKPYYPYNAGELISVKTSAHQTVGKNFSEESYGYANMFSRYIPKGTVVTASCATASGGNAQINYYRANQSRIDYWTLYTDIGNGRRKVTFTLLEDAYYWAWTGYQTEKYQLEIGSGATSYEPFAGNTYPLDSDLELRGIPKLDASNNLYYDGDTYKHDGSVTRKYVEITLTGTETIGAYDSSTLYGFNIVNAGFPAPKVSTADSSNNITSIIANYGYTGGYSQSSAHGKTKAIAISKWSSAYYMYFSVDDYADATAFKTWLATQYSNGNPVKIVYEKATATTETADAFEEIQKVTPIYGTEEFVDSRTVPMPVGNNTQYLTRDIYGGTVDLVSGLLTVTHGIVDLGSRDWYYISAADHQRFRCTNVPSDMKDGVLNQVGDILCSALTPATYNQVYGHTNDGTISVAYGNEKICIYWSAYTDATQLKSALSGVYLCYPLATPQTYQLTPQQIQTLVGKNNVWSEQGDVELSYHIPITNLLVKRQDVDDVSGDWLTLYSQPITQASDMDFTFIDFTNQYGKTYKYALVPLLTQTQSGVEVEVEGGYTVSDEVQSIFDGVFIVDSTGSQKCKANVGYGNVDMNQTVGTITPIGAKHPIVITNSKNQYHNGSISGTIVPDDYYFNGNLSRIDMVNKRNELEQFLTNKRVKIIKDWNGNIWLVMIMDNVSCTFNNNYGMGIVNFSTNWVEVGDPTNQQDLQATGLIDIGGV